jgi:serine phosphatase RsbU (regulator of sigma subunit)
MPRLIAIEGPESGLALPISSAETVLAVGPDRRVKATRPPEPRPPAGAAIRRASDRAYTIARFAAPGAPPGPPLLVNGEAVEQSALHHGDLVSYGGVTLIFDGDDVGRADTQLAPHDRPAAATAPGAPPGPPPGVASGGALPAPQGAHPAAASAGAPAREAGGTARRAAPHAGRKSGARAIVPEAAACPAPLAAPTPLPVTGAHATIEESDAGIGDSIVLRRKAYRDAEALLAALDAQEAALRAGAAPHSRGGPAAPVPAAAPAPGAPTGSPPRRARPSGRLRPPPSSELPPDLAAFRASGPSRDEPPSGAPEAAPGAPASPGAAAAPALSGAAAAAGEAVRSPERRLAFLLKVSTAVGGTLDLPTLLGRLLDLVFEEVPADRGAILLIDKAARKLRSMAGKRRGARPGEAAPVRVSRTILKEALSSQESILTLDAMSDERFRLGESIAAAGIRSAMCVPIVRDGRPLGVIHLDTGERGAAAFGRDDLDLVSAVASVVSLSIENARLYQEAAERERMRAEIGLAAQIQQRLLPKAAPASRALDVAGRTIPAKELGGDIFDFIEDAAGGTLHVLVGDVSGKGVGAGLVMAMARSYIRPLASAYISPREALARANRLLYDDTSRDMFMSAILLLWDERARRLTYCGAGQEHLLIVRAGSERCEAYPAGGIALMMVEDADPHLEEMEVDLASGDLLVLYSDGVIDARDPEGRFYGLERLTASLPAMARGASAADVVERICADVLAHTGAAEQHDDVTVVALRMR